MENTSVLSRLRWAVLAWLLLLPSGPVGAANGLVVQHIGDLSGTIAEAIAEDAAFAGVTIVPFSLSIDPSTTPIIIARGTLSMGHGRRIHGLWRAERRAIQQAYDAGQVILLLDASPHAIEALHVLVQDGVAHESSTDPIVLAYALRQENNVPTARVVTHLRAHSSDDDPDADDRAFLRAVDMVISELLHVPAVSVDEVGATTPPDWTTSPVQTLTLSATDFGIYNTPVAIYALHSCQPDADGIVWDHYVVNTGGDWTPHDASYSSASAGDANGISFDPFRSELDVQWQNTKNYCTADLLDYRICRYSKYPLYYEVDIVPPGGPRVVQLNAAPAGTQGTAASYSSGVTFSITGNVSVSGNGPAAGIQAGVSWNNSVSTTVPPLIIQAGDLGNEGAFTRYRYCTAGSKAQDCTSSIQMVGQQWPCENFIVGEPQQGQTPQGRLSDVAQTVHWQVDPATYSPDSTTFDITVTWKAEIATSTSQLWTGIFDDIQGAPIGYCNAFFCSCSIETSTTMVTRERTFKVPRPSTCSDRDVQF